jgi:peptide/nickel transport system permease protein
MTLSSRGRVIRKRFLQNRLAVAGLITLAGLFVVAYLHPFFYHWSYESQDLSAGLAGPSASHWWGTNQIGRDIFAKSMRGLQKSLLIGVVGTLISTFLAAVVGACAGYYRGRAGKVLMFLVDILLVLPPLFIVAILSPVFRGSSWLLLVVLLAAFQWMIAARTVRAMALELRERAFVKAARFMGVPDWRIIVTHILPNVSSFLVSEATLNVSALILAEVGLAYFGFSVQPPDVSLGTMIYDGIEASIPHPWQFYFPAGCLVVLVLSFNAIGEGLRDAFDPSSRKAVV